MPKGSPIYNPDVQSDIDMKNTWKIVNMPGSTGETFDDVTLTDVFNFTPKEIWISADRTDGKGLGTQVDPFDGSTAAKVTAIHAALAVNSTVHFGPGVFQANNIIPKAGCKYIGAGWNTELKVTADDGSTHFAAVFNCLPATVDGVEVRNMTINANGAALVAANSADYKADGVNLKGANCVISNVHLIGAYGHIATLRESFGLTIESTGNGLIEQCLVDGFASGNDYGQMIGFVGASDGGTVLDCEVNGQTTNTSAYVAYGSNITLENARAVNCKNFLYMDTGDVDNVTVRGCKGIGITGNFINLAQASTFSHHDVVVDDSVVDFAATGGAFFGAGSSDSTHLYNVTLTNNTTTQSIGTYYVPYNITSTDNFRESNNSWLGNAVVGNVVFDPASNNYNMHAQFAAQNINSALVGSVKVTGNFSSGGSLFYQFNPADYTVVSGDRLKYEIFCPESDVSFRPTTYIQFSDASTTIPSRDQNGIVQLDSPGDNDKSDIGGFSKGRWYEREFDLTSFATKISRYFKLGWRGLDSTQTGIHTFFIRNARVVDKKGSLKQSFYAEEDAAPTLASNSGVSGYSGTVVSTALGYVAENVANKSQIGGYASLDGSGKVPAAELPTLASGTIASTSALLKGDGSGNAVAATQTGSGDAVLKTSPTLVTPALGVATATSINKWTLTAPSTAASITAGADNADYMMPEFDTLIGPRHIPQNSQSGAYTTVLTDSGKDIFHPAADANARTFTIDSNANVAYPIGTILVFTNWSANNLTVAITSDTLRLVGAGTTGSRIIAQYGRMVCEKIGTTEWAAIPVANVT